MKLKDGGWLLKVTKEDFLSREDYWRKDGLIFWVGREASVPIYVRKIMERGVLYINPVGGNYPASDDLIEREVKAYDFPK